MLRYLNVDLYDKNGSFYYEWLSTEVEASGVHPDGQKALEVVQARLQDSGFHIDNHIYTLREGVLHVLVELSGPRLLQRSEYDELLAALVEALNTPVILYARSRPETVWSPTGQTSFSDLQQQMLDQAQRLYGDDLKRMREGAL